MQKSMKSKAMQSHLNMIYTTCCTSIFVFVFEGTECTLLDKNYCFVDNQQYGYDTLSTNKLYPIMRTTSTEHKEYILVSGS